MTTSIWSLFYFNHFSISFIEESYMGSSYFGWESGSETKDLFSIDCSFPPFPCLILKLLLVARWLFGLTREYRRNSILRKLGNGTFVWLVLYSLERHRDEKGIEYSWTLLLWSESWCLRFQKYKYRHARGTSFPGVNENLLCLEWTTLNFTLPWESLNNFCFYK